jgi:hypothetical protein
MAPPPGSTPAHRVTRGHVQPLPRLTQRGYSIERGFGWMDHDWRVAARDAYAAVPDTAIGLIGMIRWHGQYLLTSGSLISS